MPQGSISSGRDAVGVAVVDYQVPVVETREQALQNRRKFAGFIDGMKRGYPGLDDGPANADKAEAIVASLSGLSPAPALPSRRGGFARAGNESRPLA